MGRSGPFLTLINYNISKKQRNLKLNQLVKFDLSGKQFLGFEAVMQFISFWIFDVLKLCDIVNLRLVALNLVLIGLGGAMKEAEER